MNVLNKQLSAKPLRWVRLVVAVSTLWSIVFATSLHAQGTVVSTVGTDVMVFDHGGKYLYIAAWEGAPQQTVVKPYNLATRQFEASYVLGPSNRQPVAMDIAPDDSFLLVTGGYSSGQGTLYKLDLVTHLVTTISYSDSGTNGAVGLAIAGNGTALVSTIHYYSPGPMLQIELTTGVIVVRSDAPVPKIGYKIVRDPAGQLLYFVAEESPVAVFNVLTNNFTTLNGYQRSRYGAVNRTATLLGSTDIFSGTSVDMASNGAFLRSFATTGFGVSAGGIAFDPTRDIFYTVNNPSKQIIAYDTNSFAELFRFDTNDSHGRSLIISGDGKYLALEGSAGTTLFSVPSPLPSPMPPPPPTFAKRRDMVFDHAGNYLYVTTSDGFLQRYNLAAGTLENLYSFGGSLNGVDIAADDSFLLVAQGISGIAQGAFYRIDLLTGSTTQIPFSTTRNAIEGWDVAFISNALALATISDGVSSASSNSSSLYQINLLTNTLSLRTDAPFSAGLSNGILVGAAQIQRSADYSRLYIIDSEPFAFTYTSLTNTFGPSARGAANWGDANAAVSRDGALLATRLHQYGDFSIDTAPDLHYRRTFNDGYGLAFDPTSDVVYAGDADGHIIAYDTDTFTEKSRITVGETVTFNGQFDSANLIASPDGHYLAIAIPSGIQILDVTTASPTPPQTPVYEYPSAMVFNNSGTRLYITTETGFVWPYNLSTNTFETPYNIGGLLNGIDIASDDSFLVVGQDRIGIAEGMIHKINLLTDAITDLNFPRNSDEAGSWDVAITSNNLAFFTTSHILNWSGVDTPLRQIDLATNVIALRSDAPGNGYNHYLNAPGMIYRSVDRTRLLFAETGNSIGALFTYSSPSNTFGTSFATQQFNDSRGFAVNRTGTLAQDYQQLYRLPDFTPLFTFSQIDSGVAFDSTKDVLYGVNSSADQIIAYSSALFVETARFNIGENVDAGVSHFYHGSLVASPNGRYLALQTRNDIRLIDTTTGSSTAIVASTPSPTPTPMPTATATPTSTPTPTVSPTTTPTPSATPTTTPRPSPTVTPTPTVSPTPTVTPTTTPTPTPIASPTRVQGSGAINGPSGGEASFSMNIQVQKSKKKNKVVGSFSYNDPAAGLSLSSNKISGLVLNGNQAQFSGTAKNGKRKVSFTVNVTDNGPGNLDTFSIQVSNGYSASGNLVSGDITIN